MKYERLKQRIRIESKSVTRNELGEEVVAWELLAETWAEANPLRGSEFFAAAQLQDDQIVKFIIRHRAGVQETMRVMWRGEHYDITSVISVSGGLRIMELMTRRGVRDGR